MIDLRRLRVLRAVHQHGTVTDAASALHLTASAVSQQIQALSKDLQVVLLERDGRRVRLTQAAHALLRHADVLYAQWEEATAELAGYGRGAGGLVRMSAFPTALTALLVPAALSIQQEDPAMSVEMSEAESSECFDLLLGDRIDIAVVVPLPGSPTPMDQRFDQQPLADDPQDLIVPEGHRLTDRGPIELAEAADETFIAAPGSIDQHQLILAACQAAGFSPHIVHRAQEWNAILSLVAHGFGVSLLPRLAPIPLGVPVVRVPLRGSPVPVRRLVTCIRKGSQGQPAVARGLAALRRAAASRSDINVLAAE
ncbi:LysR family transcriptional regulator [Streptomyces sp. NPDC096046]|uniref:LysR family transcriptional regulator n=1 Tax=Streptomyces sp. NPDC096046 TaxID=3155542 RepID=UPI003316FE5D